jgi:hypothetical protein
VRNAAQNKNQKLWTAGRWYLQKPTHRLTQQSRVHGKAFESCPPTASLHSPDLSPPVSLLFPEIKMALKGRFQIAEDIIRNVP